MITARHRARGASTPWYASNGRRGGGTRAGMKQTSGGARKGAQAKSATAAPSGEPHAAKPIQASVQTVAAARARRSTTSHRKVAGK